MREREIKKDKEKESDKQREKERKRKTNSIQFLVAKNGSIIKYKGTDNINFGNMVIIE